MKIGIISGASSGIGRAIVKEIDSLNLDQLWLIGRNDTELSLLKQELNTNANCMLLDLTKESSFNDIKDALSFGEYTIEYLVASAGVGYTGSLESNSFSQISNMIDLNCKGLTLLLNTCLPYMCEKGKIINIASGAGFVPQADFAVYSATKSYVISVSRALRKEVKSRKISVTAVCPGPVDTKFFSDLENVKEYKKKHLISPEAVARGAIKASKKNKAVYTPTFSIKLLHFASKILPTSLILKFAK